jgi:hypothetical protein
MTNLAYKSGGLVMKSGGLGTSCSCCSTVSLCRRLELGESVDDLFSATECTATDTVTGGTFTMYLFSWFFTECGLSTADCPLLVRGEWSFTNAGQVLGGRYGCTPAGGTLDVTVCTPSGSPPGYAPVACNGSDGMWFVEPCGGAPTNNYTVTFTVRGRL